ncbi:uncharacterized protein LOC143146123 [Ptiloglossa arizonensis]|uniref:uncharacterized protein LOC143146123 n=1 Tax=Ptiloglossa arizonensis TaxID=3350558 RepID=UPI003FA0D18D
MWYQVICSLIYICIRGEASQSNYKFNIEVAPAMNNLKERTDWMDRATDVPDRIGPASDVIAWTDVSRRRLSKACCSCACICIHLRQSAANSNIRFLIPGEIFYHRFPWFFEIRQNLNFLHGIQEDGIHRGCNTFCLKSTIRLY